jgi:hypothetical protein
MATRTKLLKLNQPLFKKDGTEVELLTKLPSGNLVFIDGNEKLAKTDKYGRSVAHGGTLVTNDSPITVEYLSLYPNGNVYRKDCCPVRSSIHGVENLIQIKVTKRGGKIISKEFC